MHTWACTFHQILAWRRALGPRSAFFTFLQKAGSTDITAVALLSLTYQHRAVRPTHTFDSYSFQSGDRSEDAHPHVSSLVRSSPLWSIRLHPLWGSVGGTVPLQELYPTAHLWCSSYGQRAEWWVYWELGGDRGKERAVGGWGGWGDYGGCWSKASVVNGDARAACLR